MAEVRVAPTAARSVVGVLNESPSSPTSTGPTFTVLTSVTPA